MKDQTMYPLNMAIPLIIPQEHSKNTKICIKCCKLNSQKKSTPKNSPTILPIQLKENVFVSSMSRIPFTKRKAMYDSASATSSPKRPYPDFDFNGNHNIPTFGNISVPKINSVNAAIRNSPVHNTLKSVQGFYKSPSKIKKLFFDKGVCESPLKKLKFD
jgi:hypothetical protein